MGLQRANEFLLLNKKMTAKEFKELGMVNDIFQPCDLLDNVLKIADRVAKLPNGAVIATKKLVRDGMHEKLKEVSDRELEVLVDRFMSEEVETAFMEFFQEQMAKKEKKKAARQQNKL